jgi:predicted nucleotidyltransferase
MARTDPDERLTSIEYDALQRVLSDHPVRFAIVFGSQVRGDTHPTSDVDLAVAFDDSTSEQEYADARLGLIADLTSALGQNAVDVADLNDMKPAVGKSALEHGVVVVGSQDRADRYLEQFTQAASPSNRTRCERFDDLLTQIEELV